MTLALAGALAALALALIDSTSFGTLMIPLWLMLAPGRMRAGRIVLFLVTVAVFYFGVGLAIMFGAEAAVAQLGGFFSSRLALTVLFAAGVTLIIWSFLLEAKAKREKKAGAPTSARILRWRDRAVGSGASGAGGSGRSGGVALMGLALGAGTVEVATMLPYLGAIGLLTTSDVQWPVTGAVFAAYCLVMILPALVILVLRLVAARWVDPILRKLDGWLTRNSTNTLSWVVGILGVLLVVNTAGEVL
ncbi:GAP family protein [Arthrobacter sp. H20]|uniref:GAP family protein n=1 Tax=Arthrobacter sp. H20 TaxID=1267981 RepID=UPI00047A56E1|nr:GAP family protein [Arthrobacter sp. H20]